MNLISYKLSNFVRTLIELLIVYQRILKNGSSKCYYCIFTMYRESEVK